MKQINRFFWALFFTMALTAQLAWSAPSLDDSVNLLARRMADNLVMTNLKVTIGKLTIARSEFSSEFADRYLDLLKVELKRNTDDFKDVKRKALTRGGLRRSGLISRPDAANESPTDVMLEGTYKDNKNTGVLMVFVKLLDYEGKTVSSSEVAIDRATIPWSTEPPNLKEIQKTEQIIDATPEVEKAFDFEISIDKGPGGVYKEGEEVKVYIETAMDCFVKVLYVDNNGNRYFIYPNKYNPDHKFRKGEIYELNNTFTVIEPFGSELMIAFASDKPFEKDVKAAEIGSGYKGFSSKERLSDIVTRLRGLDVGAKRGLRSEARVALTTVKKR